MEASGVRNVTVDAFFEGHLFRPAQIVALPVARSVRSFTPIFFYVIAVDDEFVRRTFVESCEISAEHDEVRAHRERERYMIVVHDAAVRAYRNIDTGFFIPLVARFRHFDRCGCLTSPDSFLFPSDADGTSADSDFNKIGARFGEKVETVSVDDVAGTDFDALTPFFVDVFERTALPFGKSFRRVEAEHVGARIQKKGYAFHIIPRIDAGSDRIAFLRVVNFERVLFAVFDIFSEHERLQIAVFIDDRKLIDFVFPNQIVRIVERNARFRFY